MAKPKMYAAEIEAAQDMRKKLREYRKSLRKLDKANYKLADKEERDDNYGPHCDLDECLALMDSELEGVLGEFDYLIRELRACK